ncbi:MAG: LacI family DNA-binding transcriptional regulator [bacterium]
MTLKDIAQMAKVSVNTVSKVINHKPGVSQETRDTILKIAEDVGYFPNILARSLRLSETKTIGVVMPDCSNPFFACVVKGIQDGAREAGYSIVLYNTEENSGFEQEAIDLLLSLRVAGLLITPTLKKPDYILKLKQLRIPFILLDRHFEEIATNYVITDNMTGGFIATQRLIDRGHQKIAFINGSYQNSTAKARFRGYQKALEENKIVFNDSLVDWGNVNMEDGYNAMRRILAKERPPLGVLSYCDYVAMGAGKAVRDKNLRIPEDVSLVGYDDIDFARYLDVPLTTVCQPKDDLGKKGVEILIDIIEGKLSNEEEFQRLLLQPRLVIRKSG